MCPRARLRPAASGDLGIRIRRLIDNHPPGRPVAGCIRRSYTPAVSVLPEFFPDVTGIQWDAGNSGKSWARHEVSDGEAEQVFFNRPIVVAGDPKHSVTEVRHAALGRTDAGRGLAVVFTLRGSLLRVISARPMSRRERKVHDEAEGP